MSCLLTIQIHHATVVHGSPTLPFLPSLLSLNPPVCTVSLFRTSFNLQSVLWIFQVIDCNIPTGSQVVRISRATILRTVFCSYLTDRDNGMMFLVVILDLCSAMTRARFIRTFVNTVSFGRLYDGPRFKAIHFSWLEPVVVCCLAHRGPTSVFLLLRS